MTNQVVANLLLDTANTFDNANAAVTLEQIRNIINELAGGSASSLGGGFDDITISSDSITPVSYSIRVIPATGAADFLDTIVSTNFPEGRYIRVFPKDAGDTITIVHTASGTDKISLTGGANFAIQSTKDWIQLIKIGTQWFEIARNTTATGVVNHAHYDWTVPPETPDAIIVVFTLPETTITNSLEVILDSARQFIGDEITLTDGGTTVTFVTAPIGGAVIKVKGAFIP